MADESDEVETILVSTDEDDSGEESSSESESDEDAEPEREKRRRIAAADDEASSPQDSDDTNLGEIDGLICSVCMEPWTDAGDHHIWYPISFHFGVF